MRVDHLQLGALHLDAHPERAARLEPAEPGMAGQGSGLHQPLWQRRQNRVAVEFLLHLQRGVEAEGHAEPLGEPVRLVDAAGARAPHVELLQGDDVRRLGRDHLGHAADVQHPVDADATVDVVGEEPDHALCHIGARAVGWQPPRAGSPHPAAGLLAVAASSM